MIKRIDFPVGLTAAEKKKYLENYIRVHQIGEVKNIIFDLSNPEKEGNLKACNYIYLDYVV